MQNTFFVIQVCYYNIQKITFNLIRQTASVEYISTELND